MDKRNIVYWITHYKVNKELPDEVIRPYLTMEFINDIEADIYKVNEIKNIKCSCYEDLVKTLNDDEKYEVSDIINWGIAFDTGVDLDEETKEKIRDGMNHLIMTAFGFEEIRIDHGTLIDFTSKFIGSQEHEEGAVEKAVPFIFE